MKKDMKMGILSELEPRRVFEFFELCSSVPHGSGNTKQVSDICVNWARSRGLDVTQDTYNNVIIRKPASKGYENAPTVILQGHLDMVCAKYPEDDLDMSKEPIKLMTDGEFVWADRTSLGGDDMIAVATAMAILDDDKLEHPALEAVFTTDEETGLNGAWGIDPSELKGRLMLNMDSEDEGVFTSGCAGGVRSLATLPLAIERRLSGVAFYNLSVAGLIGGHSGAEIQCERGNSNLLCARIVREVAKRMPVFINSIRGGIFDNVIPSKTVAVFAVPEGKTAEAESVMTSAAVDIKNELAAQDHGFCAVFEKCGCPGKVNTAVDSKKVLNLLFSMPNGVQGMSRSLENLVETSLSMGILDICPGKMMFKSSIRSSVQSRKEWMADRVKTLVETFGGTVDFANEYPAWQYQPQSDLRDTACRVYKNLYGRDAQVLAIHAGLECGIFASKLEGLDCIAFGPNMRDIHSVNEKLEVASVERFYRLVCAILKELN